MQQQQVCWKGIPTGNLKQEVPLYDLRSNGAGRSGADPGFWSREPNGVLNPEGGPEPKICLVCLKTAWFWKNPGGKVGLGPQGPPGAVSGDSGFIEIRELVNDLVFEATVEFDVSSLSQNPICTHGVFTRWFCTWLVLLLWPHQMHVAESERNAVLFCGMPKKYVNVDAFMVWSGQTLLLGVFENRHWVYLVKCWPIEQNLVEF